MRRSLIYGLLFAKKTESLAISPSPPVEQALAVATTTPPQEQWINSNHQNAFHIFNAIHSAMRQWGSSLNHNGMSFFPAIVPAGTLLYRGSSSTMAVEGMQWLAFEPEHAQQFADGLFRPPPKTQHVVQNLIGPSREPRAGPRGAGYLHTYATTKDLHLIYLDGMSGGKTLNGTLDTQDLVLLNNTSPPAFWEYERGQGLCDIAQNDWQGKVDGFIRMEAGFEVILCDIAAGAERKSVLTSRRRGRSGGSDAKQGKAGDAAATPDLKYLRAVADRYHGIGGNRVELNCEKMVTAYSLGGDLFASGERGPRLKHLSSEGTLSLRRQVDEMVLATPSPWENLGHDWQAVVDTIVTRYSTRLAHLLTPAVWHDKRALDAEIDDILSPSIDYNARSMVDENVRCANHLLPMAPYFSLPTSLAANAVSYVANYICYALVSIQYGEIATRLWAKQRVISELVQKLNWTTWKECGRCGPNEVCSIPLWPYGSEEDWQDPKCRNASTIYEQRGYWGKKSRPWDKSL